MKEKLRKLACIFISWSRVCRHFFIMKWKIQPIENWSNMLCSYFPIKVGVGPSSALALGAILVQFFSVLSHNKAPKSELVSIFQSAFFSLNYFSSSCRGRWPRSWSAMMFPFISLPQPSLVLYMMEPPPPLPPPPSSLISNIELVLAVYI